MVSQKILGVKPEWSQGISGEWPLISGYPCQPPVQVEKFISVDGVKRQFAFIAKRNFLFHAGRR
jgi:hypothetical protein